jgi:hypothetical protein
LVNSQANPSAPAVLRQMDLLEIHDLIAVCQVFLQM